MECFRGLSFLLLPVLLSPLALRAQDASSAPVQQKPTKLVPNIQTQTQTPAPPIAANAPRMSKQTRYEIIRDFETQIVYARSAFPMGALPPAMNCSRLSLCGDLRCGPEIPLTSRT
jgi:hypothetical protein